MRIWCIKIVLSDSSSLSHDKTPSSAAYVIIGVITTLLVVAMIVIVVLVYINGKLRKKPSQQYVSQLTPPADHSQMTETRDYDKLGVRQPGEYMEITAVNDQTPQDSSSNYVNETLR